jgi:hypothetical protein
MAQIPEQAIDAGERQLPARVRVLLAGQRRDDLQHGLAVGLKEPLCEHDSQRATISRDLAVVRFDRDISQASVFPEWEGDPIDRG